MGFYILSKNIQSPVAFQVRNKLIDFCQIDQKKQKKTRALQKQCKKNNSSCCKYVQDKLSWFSNTWAGHKLFQTSSSDFQFCDSVRLKIHN